MPRSARTRPSLERSAEVDHRQASAIARPLGRSVASGEPLVSGTVYPMPKIEPVRPRLFSGAATGSEAGTYVSEVLKARAADTTFFTLSRRSADAKGTFAGVTTVSIAPEYFIDFYAKLPPPGVFAADPRRRCDSRALSRISRRGWNGCAPNSTVHACHCGTTRRRLHERHVDVRRRSRGFSPIAKCRTTTSTWSPAIESEVVHAGLAARRWEAT